jgi:hypothetical protein
VTAACRDALSETEPLIELVPSRDSAERLTKDSVAEMSVRASVTASAVYVRLMEPLTSSLALGRH